jgi:hypothetical protein
MPLITKDSESMQALVLATVHCAVCLKLQARRFKSGYRKKDMQSGYELKG